MKSESNILKLKKAILVFSLAMMGMVVGVQGQSQGSVSILSETENRVDELFRERYDLLKEHLSTREVDLELASHGIRFPAHIQMTRLDGETNIVFAVMENCDDQNVLQKADRMTTEIDGLARIKIDRSKALCFATFNQTAGNQEMETLLHAFFYDGYIVSETSSPQLMLSEN